MPKNDNKKRHMFKLLAPDAEQVSLVGSFNDWDTTCRPLKKDKKGAWKTTVTLERGHYEYLYWVDGQWQQDPACELLETNPFGTKNCVVEV